MFLVLLHRRYPPSPRSFWYSRFLGVVNMMMMKGRSSNSLSDFISSHLQEPADVQKQTIILLQTADICSSSEATADAEADPQTTYVLALKNKQHLTFYLFGRSFV